MNITHSKWRSCQEWRQIGLPMTTTSDAACRLFDAILTQYVRLYNDPSVGGLASSINVLLSEHKDFVLGHVLVVGISLLGACRSPRLDSDFRRMVDDTMTAATRPEVTQRERRHAEAMKAYADCDVERACCILEDIIVDHPTDMMALKFASFAHFYAGHQRQIRDSVARALPHWHPDMPLYGFLLGMYAYGLVETNLFAEAEKVARKGIELNPSDAWSVHALAHVFEMTGRYDEGLAMMAATVDNWEPCDLVACHVFWHWAVFHLETGDSQRALDIFDSEVLVRAQQPNSMLSLADACSLLKRLEFEGVDVGERWRDVMEVCLPHMRTHLVVYYDVHMLMSSLGARRRDVTDRLMESMRQFVRDGRGHNRDVTEYLGLPICDAFIAYDEGRFGDAVELYHPLRYRVGDMSGSDAQRDVFSQFLISAALKSSSAKHHKLARHLLAERKALKENSPLTDRLMAKAKAL